MTSPKLMASGRWLNPGDPPQHKKPSARRKLTAEQVARIRKCVESLALLAREFGVSVQAVYYCRRYYTYRELP